MAVIGIVFLSVVVVLAAHGFWVRTRRSSGSETALKEMMTAVERASDSVLALERRLQRTEEIVISESTNGANIASEPEPASQQPQAAIRMEASGAVHVLWSVRDADSRLEPWTLVHKDAYRLLFEAPLRNSSPRVVTVWIELDEDQPSLLYGAARKNQHTPRFFYRRKVSPFKPQKSTKLDALPSLAAALTPTF